ncbi:transglutaminase-like domain-containing protein [Aquimarina rhabdastrellae]
MEKYLKETFFFNYSHPIVKEFILQHLTGEERNAVEQTQKLYIAVRDHWRYNPYHFTTQKEDWQVHALMQRPDGHCLDKGIILISCLRAIGIPARLCLAKVKNHLGVEKLLAYLGSDVIVPHGYIEVFLNDSWIILTPAFNKELCEIMKVDVMDFDGKNGTVFQAYNSNGNQFMEYLEDYGHFDDLPLEKITQLVYDHYPVLRDKMKEVMF